MSGVELPTGDRQPPRTEHRPFQTIRGCRLARANAWPTSSRGLSTLIPTAIPTAPRLIEDRRRGQGVDNPANAVPLIPWVAPTKAWRTEWTAGRTARAFVLPRSVFHRLPTDAIPSATKAAVGRRWETRCRINDRPVHLDESGDLPDGPNPSGRNIACFKRSGALGCRAPTPRREPVAPPERSAF